jgi:hypothetical protein
VFNNSIELAINETYLKEESNNGIKDYNSIAIIINKEKDIIESVQGFKKCNICFGKNSINDKTCFACEGKGIFNLSKSMFKYFEALKRYGIYVSISHEYIENNNRIIRKFPLIKLISDEYLKEYLDKFQDELQLISIAQYCEGNIIQKQDIINCLVTDEAKSRIKLL